MKTLLIVSSLIFAFQIDVFSQKENVLEYILTHSPESNKINIMLNFKEIEAKKVKLVIPRSGPGTYELTNYRAFVQEVTATTKQGNKLQATLGIGSHFEFATESNSITSISYFVDINKMEKELLSASSSSKKREKYLGLLGYSVFGFIEGQEHLPINLTINTHTNWPIFSTISPSVERKTGSDSFRVSNYAELADGQYLLGEGVRIASVPNSPIPLYVAVYSETEYNIKEIGRRALIALNGLKMYYGFIPMPHYTLCYEFLTPISPRHDYGFSMEHLNSMTASFDAKRAILAYEEHPNIGSMIHHIGHSWIPLRSYGVGYRPFEWQTAPLIETIWFNEGFTWYIAYYHVLNDKKIIDRFNKIINTAPTYINKKSLRELSLLGSSQYGADFRIGMNLFARGALLAHELEMKIIKQSEGKKSFKDIALALMEFTEKKHRAFEYEEIEQIMTKAVEIDISDIWTKWQEPILKD